MEDPEDEPLELLSIAVCEGTADNVRNVIEKYDIDPVYLYDELETAAVNDKIEALKVLLGYLGHGTDLEYLPCYWSKIIENGAARVARDMLRRGIMHLTREEWQEVLEEAMKKEQDGMIVLAMERLPEWDSEGQNIYFRVLHFLIREEYELDKFELVEWMISLHNPTLRSAARSVIGEEMEVDANSDIVPLRALMLCMLYPTLSLEEAIDELKKEGVSGRQLQRCELLLRAYLEGDRI